MKNRGEDTTGVYFFRTATLQELKELAQNAGARGGQGGGAGKRDPELLAAGTPVTIIENINDFY